MAYLKIHKELVTDEAAGKLVQVCPFSAITYENGLLDINAACKMCKMCVKKGPKGVITLEEDEPAAGIDKSLWKGIAVFVEHLDGNIHNVTFELLGKARKLAGVINHPVYALMIGSGIRDAAQVLLRYGADKVFVYDYPRLKDFILDTYANVFEDFINKVKPTAILVGATNIGRSLAPRVAARFRTGLTADCTKLVMRENTDLVQIRPAFGGNIMAQIVTTNSRPQFCTVRYKVFSAPEPAESTSGSIEIMDIAADRLVSRVELIKLEKKPAQVDISEAEVIVAVGRGIRSEQDMEAVKELASLLGAQVACTRPLVEAGWFDAKHQIGLSGRTVGAKLIITLGISGSVQFAAGMRGSECIIAVNSDRNAPIFDIAHYCVVGDLYKILPELIERCKEVKKHGIS
jgi:electron transfer flavoprotein alpha subunit